MGRVQYYCAQSLDGYIADPADGLDWLLQFGHPSEATPGTGGWDEFYAGVGATAMGARTYEVIVGNGEQWAYGDCPTWVFTHRELPVPDGADVRFTHTAVAEAVPAMQEAAGERTIWVCGGGELAAEFIDAGLLDDFVVTIAPVWLGAGIPTFAGSLGGRLRLADTRRFSSGLAQLVYEVD